MRYQVRCRECKYITKVTDYPENIGYCPVCDKLNFVWYEVMCNNGDCNSWSEFGCCESKKVRDNCERFVG